MFICCITAFVVQIKNCDIMIDEVSVLHFVFLERDVEPSLYLHPKAKPVTGGNLSFLNITG